MPAYVGLPKMHPSGGPAYLGAAHAPFVIDADPNAAELRRPRPRARRPPSPPTGSTTASGCSKPSIASIAKREARANKSAGAVGAFRDKAFDLMTSRDAKKAFDIHAESDKLRDAVRPQLARPSRA